MQAAESVAQRMVCTAACAAAGDQWRINFSRVQWNVTWDEQLQTYVKV
jgi:hypothetical protein